MSTGLRLNSTLSKRWGLRITCNRRCGKSSHYYGRFCTIVRTKIRSILVVAFVTTPHPKEPTCPVPNRLRRAFVALRGTYRRPRHPTDRLASTHSCPVRAHSATPESHIHRSGLPHSKSSCYRLPRWPLQCRVVLRLSFST